MASDSGVTTRRWINAPLLLYHGTLAHHVPSILAGIDLRRVRPLSDFGPGFYTTTSEGQAWELAQTRADHRPGSTPALLRFDVPRRELSVLRCLFFIRGDLEAQGFWSFVRYCREGRLGTAELLSGTDGWYDVITGPVAIDFRTRRVRPSSDQIGFHTARAVELLHAAGPRGFDERVEQ